MPDEIFVRNKDFLENYVEVILLESNHAFKNEDYRGLKSGDIHVLPIAYRGSDKFDDRGFYLRPITDSNALEKISMAIVDSVQAQSEKARSGAFVGLADDTSD